MLVDRALQVRLLIGTHRPERAILDLGLDPLDLREHALALRSEGGDVGGHEGRVESGENLSRPDPIPDLDVQLLDDRGLEGLDDDSRCGGDEPALGAHDAVDLGDRCPGDCDKDQTDHEIEQGLSREGERQGFERIGIGLEFPDLLDLRATPAKLHPTTPRRCCAQRLA